MATMMMVAAVPVIVFDNYIDDKSDSSFGGNTYTSITITTKHTLDHDDDRNGDVVLTAQEYCADYEVRVLVAKLTMMMIGLMINSPAVPRPISLTSTNDI